MKKITTKITILLILLSGLAACSGRPVENPNSGSENQNEDLNLDNVVPSGVRRRLSSRSVFDDKDKPLLHDRSNIRRTYSNRISHVSLMWYHYHVSTEIDLGVW